MDKIELSTAVMLLQILGGVGLLLYGIEIMKNSLERLTEGTSSKVLELSSKNTLMSILAGAVVTTINQKSTTTTVLVVGMVNAGVMGLAQAAGVIMGANIGTTITAQLLAFRLTVAAPCIVGVAAFFWRYIKKKRVQYMAEVFVGGGIMFIGMMFIENAMTPLQDSRLLQIFVESTEHMSFRQYLLIIIVGFTVTAFVKSSSALVGVMIAMASQGLFTIDAAVPFVMGLNIGKCLTAIFYSRSATRTAKRAAVIHLLFNTFGTILVIVFFRGFFVNLMEMLAPNSVPRQIANAHTIFNLGTTLIAIPLIPMLVKLSGKLVPVKKEEEKREVSNLDIRMLETPGIALAQANNEISQMAALALNMYDWSYQAVRHTSEKLADRVAEEEDNIVRMQKEIEIYLLKLSKKDLADGQKKGMKLLLGVIGDVERISDVSYTIASLVEYKKQNTVLLNNEAYEDLDNLHERIKEVADKIVRAVREEDSHLANSLMSAEIRLKNMEDSLREKHVERLNDGSCGPGSGILYLDMLGHMERVVEYLQRIGVFVVEYAKC